MLLCNVCVLALLTCVIWIVFIKNCFCSSISLYIIMFMLNVLSHVAISCHQGQIVLAFLNGEISLGLP